MEPAGRRDDASSVNCQRNHLPAVMATGETVRLPAMEEAAVGGGR